ncbi:MAG: hypothetical protein AB1Z66_04890 [Candidatus Limnocylindrales bacterium]
MNAERRREPQLEHWFAERAASLREPREGFEEMLAMIAVTPQRHHHWWPSIPAIGPRDGWDGRLRGLAMALSSGLAALLLVAVFGFLAQGLLVGPAASLPPPSGTANEALMPAAVETSAVTDAEASAEAATSTQTESDVALERYQAVLSGLEMKTVAPGVTRVVADATGRRMRKIDQLVIAPDGRVWVTKRDRLVEVAEPGGFDHPGGELLAGRDGRLFSVGSWFSPAVSVLDADGWQPLDAWPKGEPSDWRGWGLVGTSESGDLWATATDAGVPRPARLDGDAWTDFEPRDMDIDWPAGADLELVGVADLEIASDGSVWAWLRSWPVPEAPRDGQDTSVLIDTLAHYDGASWKEVSLPGGPLMPLEIDYPPGPGEEVLHPGYGGSMWVQRSYPDAELMHWDGEAWLATLAPRSSDLVIDRDERVWCLKRQGDPALLMLDGSAWSTYEIPLALSEGSTLHLAPDDDLWILSAGRPYILHPDEMEPDGGAQS